MTRAELLAACPDLNTNASILLCIDGLTDDELVTELAELAKDYMGDADAHRRDKARRASSLAAADQCKALAALLAKVAA